MDQRKLADLLLQQEGVISMKQAVSCGLSTQAVQRRVTDKVWERQAKGVYLDRSHVRSRRTRLRAAVLSAGKDAAVHGRSAAWWHGLCDKPPNRPSITIPSAR